MTVDHRAMTEYRLEKSRRIIERQRELVAKRRSAGQPAAYSESVLATFERSHAALERSLVWIVQEEGLIAREEQGGMTRWSRPRGPEHRERPPSGE